MMKAPASMPPQRFDPVMMETDGKSTSTSARKTSCHVSPTNYAAFFPTFNFAHLAR